MDKGYNFYNLEASFKKFLIAGIEGKQNNANTNENQHEIGRKKLKKISVKNYLSDLRHFLGWLIFYWKSHSSNTNPSLSDQNMINILKQVQDETIEKYKSYLISNNIPLKTINRRLSTIRKFFSFCISQGWIKENPAKKISNIKYQILIDTKKALSHFQNDLQKEGLDQNTIKSYLDTIQEFLSL